MTKNRILNVLIAAGIGFGGWMAIPQTAEAGHRDHMYSQPHAPVCRDFTRISFQYGQFRENYGTACLRRDGNWYVVSENGWPGGLRYQRIDFSDRRDRYWNDRRERYYEGRGNSHDDYRHDHHDRQDRRHR